MTISVLMSVHNGERYVREAVESIFAQTYRDFEFIIVDDGSTDKTAEILNEYAKKDNRVIIITNETNLGLTRSLNLALQSASANASADRQARGIYIARMDADDIALPERLERQIKFLDQHRDIGLVGTAYEWIDEDGTVITQRDVLTTHNEIHHALIRTNPFLHGSIMMRKKILDQAGGYNETYKKAQDYDLWLRLAGICQFANLPDVLMQKRMSKNMISFNNEQAQIQFAVRARLDALKRGDYPWWCVIFLLKPYLAILLPVKLVRFIRIHIFGQKIYAHSTLQ